MSYKTFSVIAVVSILLATFMFERADAGNNGGHSFKTWPDTGQTKCYNNSAEITCPSVGQPFHGQDAQYQGYSPSFTDNGNGTVTDNITGLVWEQKNNMDGVVDYANSHDADNTYTWFDPNPETNGGSGVAAEGTASDNDTQDFIGRLNSSNFGGSNDWRMPTIKELVTLVDYTRANDLSIFPNFTATKMDTFYWSSTTQIGSGGNGGAWVMFFGSGGGAEASNNKSYGHYVRAVRDGQQQPENQFIDNGDGTVTDSETCLQWQKRAVDNNNDGFPDQFKWQNALKAAEDLTLAGKSDWRLPNIHELRTLVDFKRSEPAIDPIFPFPISNDPNSFSLYLSMFWSSTTYALSNDTAWGIAFRAGGSSAYAGHKLNDYFVRAVRGKQCGSVVPPPINSQKASFLPGILLILD